MSKRAIVTVVALASACALAGGGLAPLAPHPRLFVGADGFAAAKARLESSAEGRAGLVRAISEADAVLPKPVLMRQMEGRRLLGTSREAINRIGRLSFAWKMTGDRKYADRAIAEARAVASFPDWNPSHFLDVAEMTFAVAIARDWLDDALSDPDKKLLAEAILKKALAEPDGKTLRKGGWSKARNNWNQVCNGGLAAGAAAVREDYPEIAEAVLRRSRANLPIAMKQYAGGNFPEGPGYWAYASDYTAIALDVLERQFADGAPELFATEGLADQVEYMNAVTGPTGIFFNYSDPFSNAAPRRAPVAACWYFALRFNRAAALARHEVPLFRSGKGAGRMTPLMLLWFRDTGVPKVAVPPTSMVTLPVPSGRVLGGSNPIAVLGTRREPPLQPVGEWYVGIKGGTPSASHGHMDAGSFVLDSSGVRWACDLGCESYNRIEQMKTVSLWNFKQDSSRWSLFRLGTEGHGTLQIDGEQQNVNGFAKLSGSNPVVADLSSLYPSAKSVMRTFELKPLSLSVRDELKGLRPGAVVTWNMNTAEKVVSAEGNMLCLEAKGDAKLDVMRRRLLLTATPSDVVWETESIEAPRTPADSPNPGITRIRFRRTAGEDGCLEFAVEAKDAFGPVSAEDAK